MLRHITGNDSHIRAHNDERDAINSLQTRVEDTLPSSWTPTWSKIKNKPDTFPPSIHTHSDILADLITKQETSEKGQPGGYASLDETGTVPLSQLPSIASSGAASWDSITGKPATFAPSAHTHAQSEITGLTLALNSKIDSSLIGAANGVTPLGPDQKISSVYLPSYVDDVLEYSSLSAFPAVGESGKIYTAIDTNRPYRWSGSTYVWMSPSPGSTDALAEGTVNLYFTNARAASAAPVQSVAGLTGPISASSLKTSLSLNAVDNTSDVNKPVSTAQAAAINALIAEIALGNVTGAISLATYTGRNQAVTLTATGNLTFDGTSGAPAITSGTSPLVMMRVTQDGTGSRTLTTTNVQWPGGTQPALSTAAGATDIIQFRWINGVCYGLMWKSSSSSSAVSAAPLARTSYSYSAGAVTLFNAASASATSDADATNLAVTFTVPSSGKVRVELEGTTAMTASAGYVYWSLRNGTSDVAGSERNGGAMGTASGRMRNRVAITISGLTPGASITYKWGLRGSGAALGVGSGGDFLSANANNYGPAIMTVFAE